MFSYFGPLGILGSDGKQNTIKIMKNLKQNSPVVVVGSISVVFKLASSVLFIHDMERHRHRSSSDLPRWNVHGQDDRKDSP